MVYVYDAKTFEVKWPLSCDSAVLSIDWHDQRITAGCRDGTIKVFDAQSGDCLSTVRGENAIFSLAFSPDGQLIATGEGNPYNSREEGAVRIYCASTGQVKRALNVGYYAPFSLD